MAIVNVHLRAADIYPTCIASGLERLRIGRIVSGFCRTVIAQIMQPPTGGDCCGRWSYTMDTLMVSGHPGCAVQGTDFAHSAVGSGC